MSSAVFSFTHPDLERLARALAGARALDAQGEGSDRQDAVAPSAAREAAVAVILRTGDDGGLEVLMIRRAEHEGDPWSGNVALPGGHREPHDVSLQAAAVRETREETGIDLTAAGRILGRLQAVRPQSPDAPQIVVTPFIAAVEAGVEITPSAEVATAFWVPVASLRRPELWEEMTMMLRGTARRVVCFRHQENIIWGMTARILQQLFDYLS